MRTKPFLSILPLVFLIACSIEDPDTGPPKKSETPDPVPKEEPPVPEEEEEEPEPEETADTEPPSVPTGVKVSEVSFESFNLSWSASSDNDRVAHYLVFSNGAELSEVTSTSTSLTGLTPGQKYSLSVKAVDPSGNSSDTSDPIEETTLVDTEAPSIPAQPNVSGSAEAGITLTWTASSDNAGVKEYDIYLNGEFLATTNITEYLIQGLKKASTYTFSILAKDIYGNHSENSEEVKITTEAADPPDTPSPDPVAGTVLFSEYLEGSSYNKALEIVNLGAEDVSLSGYSLKKISNTNEEWSNEKFLEGTLAPGEVFVIAHARAASSIVEAGDLVVGGGIIDFNGNDLIGLFFNGKLLDVIGKPGGEDFAKDVTLRRKKSVSGPNSEFNPEEWETFEMDTADDLGKY